ncbi:MAG: carboxypeptidase-like regulatory domain-containing protein [Nitrosarchaeum sp.]
MSRLNQLALISGLIVLVSGLTGFATSQAWADGGIILSVNSLSEFKAGQYPSISGKVTDSNGNPLSDVEVQANFPSRSIMTITDSTGKFSITTKIPAQPGEYVVKIYATKGKMGINTQISYQVKENQPIIIPTDTPKEIEELKQEPSSETILQQIEEQKINDIKQKALSEEQQKIKEQRLQEQIDLKRDLKSDEKEQESHNPRNAFLSFLRDIDNSVKNIFWNQFLFTEKITNQGQMAKENALKEGKTPVEAMKMFQKGAAVTRNELIEENKRINIEYGNATNDVQQQFDEKGKLPRE